MYSVVLLAAVAGGPSSCHGCAAPALCCPVTYGCCGVVRFSWPAQATTFEAPDDARRWQEYLDALIEPERSDARELWRRADADGRRRLLEQVKAMRRPEKEREPDRQARRPEEEGATPPLSALPRP